MLLNKIIVNSTNSNTDLCKLGAYYRTDKSPWNTRVCSHSYTPFYELIFSSLRYRNVVVGEIGCWRGNSARMWRDWFPNAEIYTWDNRTIFLECTREVNNVIVNPINVCDVNSINESFLKVGKKFDIIIDDSTHEIVDHFKIINNCYKFLNPGGILVIEDLFKNIDEAEYAKILNSEVSIYYSNITIIEPVHEKSDNNGCDNEKILFLVRNNEQTKNSNDGGDLAQMTK
jgi:SAM-dependent methyltransferase